MRSRARRSSILGVVISLAACARESGRPVEEGGGPSPVTSALVAPGALPQGLDLPAVMRQVHFAFRPEGDAFTGGHGT